MQRIIYEKWSEKFNLSICNGFMHDKTSLPCCLSRIRKCTIKAMLNELIFESLIQMSSFLSIITCIRPRHIHIAMSLHASYCCISSCVDCVSMCSSWYVLPSRIFTSIQPKGSIPLPLHQASNHWSFRYNPMFSLLLLFTALRQRDSNCCVLR